MKNNFSKSEIKDSSSPNTNNADNTNNTSDTCSLISTNNSGNIINNVNALNTSNISNETGAISLGSTENSRAPAISAILLAAGFSRRMGRIDKLLLQYRGKTLLQHAVDLLASLPVSEKIIVTVPDRLSQLSLTCDIKPIINQCPELGQSSSLHLGIKACSGDSYLFLMGDQPRLTVETLKPIILLALKNPNRIIYPSVNGNPSTPIVFPAQFRDELLSVSGDSGGRSVRSAHPEACLIWDPRNFKNFFEGSLSDKNLSDKNLSDARLLGDSQSDERLFDKSLFDESLFDESLLTENFSADSFLDIDCEKDYLSLISN